MEEASIERQEMPRHTEGSLPEVKIFDLLSSVGNGENKALELIVMRKGVIYSADDLYREVMSSQARDRKWRMSRKVPFMHCENSLSPIGLVTKEALSPDGTAWGYEITRYGIEAGVPFAGLILKWSYEHPEHSMYKMFGITRSNSVKDEQSLRKKRAQETRYRIFREIATNPNDRTRLTDIADAINETPHLISHHLFSLAGNGVISYETLGHGNSFSYFRLKGVTPDGEPTQFPKNKTLSARLHDLIIQSLQQRPKEYSSVEDMARHLIQEYPEYKDINRKNFSSRIAIILSHFERQGYVERRKFSSRFQSELILLDEQREAIVSLVALINKFKSGDRHTIEEGRRFAQRVASDPNLFSELMLKAKEASPAANQANREDTCSHLISIIYEHPNSRLNQIQELLEKNYDKRLSFSGIHKNLSVLVRDGRIASDKTKSGNVYRVVEEESIV